MIEAKTQRKMKTNPTAANRRGAVSVLNSVSWERYNHIAATAAL